MCESRDGEFRKAYGYILEGRWCTAKVILCYDLIQYPFERADIFYGMLGYEFSDALFEEKFSSTGFFLEYGETCLKVWLSDVNDNSPLKSTLESGFEF